ncbi:MAG: hypothetical protein E7013_04665 [Alphaproteobacteria bacterium]|nr:hypothetical protein [Alphaproteobacteria bacterium]
MLKILQKQILDSKNIIYFILLTFISIILSNYFENFLQSLFVFFFFVFFMFSFIKIFYCKLPFILMWMIFITPIAFEISEPIIFGLSELNFTSSIFPFQILSLGYLFLIPLGIKSVYIFFGYADLKKQPKENVLEPQKKKKSLFCLFSIAAVNFLSLIPAFIIASETSLDFGNRHLLAILMMIYALISVPVIRRMNKEKKLSALKITFSHPVFFLLLESYLLSYVRYSTANFYVRYLEYACLLFFAWLVIFNIYTYHKAEAK